MSAPSFGTNRSRRSFLKQSAASTLLALTPAGRLILAQEPVDLLITGGRLIDPYQRSNRLADIAVRKGKIVQVAEALDPRQATQVIDATGLYVSPDWIDLHSHVFFGFHSIAVRPDEDSGVYTGVTAAVEAGGFEATNIDLFRREIIEKSLTRVLGFINISAHRDTPLHGDWSRFDQKLTIQTMLDNLDILKGVKVMASNRHSANLGIIPTQLAVQAARESGTRVMAHIGMAPPLVQDVLNLMEEGDIITHCFKGFPSGLFRRTGRPVEESWQALERGVGFDLGHGRLSFSWQAARHARLHNFPLHSCSTDLHEGVINGPVWTFGRTMAKCLHMGYTLDEVVEVATLGQARFIGEAKERGSLLPGCEADLTLFRLMEAPTVLTDSENKSEIGKWDFEPVHCVRAGRVFSRMKIPPREPAEEGAA